MQIEKINHFVCMCVCGQVLLMLWGPKSNQHSHIIAHGDEKQVTPNVNHSILRRR